MDSGENDVWQTALRDALASRLVPLLLGASQSVRYIAPANSTLDSFLSVDGVALADDRLIIEGFSGLTGALCQEFGELNNTEADVLFDLDHPTYRRLNVLPEVILIDDSRLFIVEVVNGAHGAGIGLREIASAGALALFQALFSFLVRAGQPELRYQDLSSVLMTEGESPVIVPAREKLAKLGRALEKNPDEVLRLSSREFEEHVAFLMDRAGFKVKVTPATRDGGRDILAHFRTPAGDILYLVECKRHRPDRLVDVSVVRALFGVVEMERANVGLIVTTSGFSKDAKTLVKSIDHRMKLKEYKEISEWLKQ